MAGSVDELLARAESRLDRMRELGEDLAAIRVSRSSPDGLVTVIVDGAGTPVELSLRPGISGSTGRDLSAAVIATAHAAAAAALERRARLLAGLQEFLSEDHPAPSQQQTAAQSRSEGDPSHV